MYVRLLHIATPAVTLCTLFAAPTIYSMKRHILDLTQAKITVVATPIDNHDDDTTTAVRLMALKQSPPSDIADLYTKYGKKIKKQKKGLFKNHVKTTHQKSYQSVAVEQHGLL